MKKIVLFVSMLFIALGASAQSMYGDAVKADVKMKYVYSLEEALKKAKEEKKPIFFNCFADWAVPCHAMNKVVFSDQKFADWMDKHFVNFFIDVTTKEGRPLADKYNIRFQAHYLVLDSDGEILYRIVGGYKLPEFQTLLVRSLNPKTTLPGMNKRYENGERNVKFLRDYAKMLKVADEPDKADQIVDEFFTRLKKSEWCKAENWDFFWRKAYNLNDEMFRFMVNHKGDFVKHNGLEKINQSITGAYFRELYPYTCGKEVYDGTKLLNLYLDMQKNGLPDTNMVYTVYDIVKYRGEKNVDKLLDILEHKTIGWDERIIGGIDLALIDLPDLSTTDEANVIAYLKKKMTGMKGNTLKAYQDAVNKVENTDGMKFENLTFDEVLKKAKKEGKLVFMDCYTTWCGPCKMMSNQVFPLKFVGDFMNAHFVNVKIDMEKGEGVELAKKYEIKAFPTMFLLNADGEPLYKILGAQDPRTFLAKVKRGMELENGYFKVKQKYAEGDRSLALVADYFIVMQDAGDVKNLDNEVISYLSSLNETDKCSKSAWKLYDNFVNNITNPEFKYLVNNRAKFVQSIGDAEVNTKIEKVIFPLAIEYLKGSVSKENMNQAWNLVNTAKFSPDYSLVLLDKIITMYDKKEYGKMLDFYEKEVTSNPDAKVRLNLDVILHRLLESAPSTEKNRARVYAQKQLENATEGAKNSYKALIEALAE